MKVSELNTRLSEAVDDNLDGNVSGDLTLLLPIIIELLVSLMGGCMSQQSRASVSERIANNDIWARIAVRRAVSQGCRECGKSYTRTELAAVRDGVRAVATADGFDEVLDEVESDNLYDMI